MTILVTGATGQYGALVVESLLTKVPANQIAVSVRDSEKANGLRAKGVDVRQADFDDTASLDAAFAGVDRLLIISTTAPNRLEQHRNAVSAAKRAGVSFIAYSSAPRANASSLSLAIDHNATEDAIRETGIPYSFLRNNWYTENEESVIQGAIGGAPVLTSAGVGKVGWVPRRDLAEAAAVVLSSEGHDNTTYELGGTPASYDQFAQALSDVLGQEVPTQHVDDETYASILTSSGLPDFLAGFIAGIQKAIREGALDVPSGDLEKLLGRPATSLRDGIAAVVKGF